MATLTYLYSHAIPTVNTHASRVCINAYLIDLIWHLIVESSFQQDSIRSMKARSLIFSHLKFRVIVCNILFKFTIDATNLSDNVTSITRQHISRVRMLTLATLPSARLPETAFMRNRKNLNLLSYIHILRTKKAIYNLLIFGIHTGFARSPILVAIAQQ